jgi:outer membrane protein assembly factor BamB
MSGPMLLTDDLIRTALTPADDVRVPFDLPLDIRTAIDATPQRRAPLLIWPSSPRQRLLLQIALVALLTIALVGGILFVGSQQHNSLASLGVTTYRGGPERTSVMPGPAPIGVPALEWSQHVGGPVNAGAPIVVDGTVYIADGTGDVAAISEARGIVEWTASVHAPINSGLSVADGLVVVGDDAGFVHALEVAGDGRERWHYNLGGTVQPSGVIADGNLYVASTNGLLVALDLATGTPVWGPVRTPGPIARTIAFANGVLYVGSGGPSEAQPGVVVAYSARDGSQIWRQRLARGNTSTISLSGGRVFVSSGLDTGDASDHHLYALDAATGVPAWSFTAPSRTILLICAIADGLVFVAGDDGNLYALDETSGNLAWKVPIHSTQSPNGGYVGGILYATSDDRKIHAIDVATGHEIWSIATQGLPTAPTIIDGRIIVGTNLGQIQSFTSAQGGS